MDMSVGVGMGVGVYLLHNISKPHSWVSSGGIFQIGIIRLFRNLVLTTYSKVEYRYHRPWYIGGKVSR